VDDAPSKLREPRKSSLDRLAESYHSKKPGLKDWYRLEGTDMLKNEFEQFEDSHLVLLRTILNVYEQRIRAKNAARMLGGLRNLIKKSLTIQVMDLVDE
jgi:hypothetical protein